MLDTFEYIMQTSDRDKIIDTYKMSQSMNSDDDYDSDDED